MEKEKASAIEVQKSSAASQEKSEAGDESVNHPDFQSKTRRKRIILICSVIFLVATGSRLLSWHDNRFEARKVQSAVTEGYKDTGRILQQGGIATFFSANSPLKDANHLGHPPGYSILIAILFRAFGESDAALQLTQILADAASSVVIFLIALALLNLSIATIAGLLIAIAPQFTYNSVMLLPDSLAVLPILLAVYFLIKAIKKRPRLLTFILAGALIGLSCWLRANALLLAPFMAAAIPFLFERGRRLRPALAFLGGSLLIILPLTIRNYIVYDHFIPVSLGAGQTLLEGIADYDHNKSLGIPNTDKGLTKWESEIYNRPDYADMLFNPDGIKRERQRLAQGFAVIRSHPFWFFGVMVRRAGSMLRLERVRLISADPPVTHSLALPDTAMPVWSNSPQDLFAKGIVESKSVKLSPAPDGQMVNVESDESRSLLTSAPISIGEQTDYVLKLPIRIERGRIMLSIKGVANNHEYASTIVEEQNWKSAAEQPLNVIEIPFVSASAAQAQIVLTNAGARGVIPIFQIGQAQLFSLGAASFTWTRVVRAPLRLIQKLFITAVMLPLAVIGLVLLIRARKPGTLVLLLIVPAYYLSVQSALHTEYRYVLAVHYFLFVLVAVALHSAGSVLLGVWLKWRSSPS
jgi:Dolichyl-phosphate-mannose-protein mannosyltransferase